MFQLSMRHLDKWARGWGPDLLGCGWGGQDNTMRMWDVKPYATGNRCLRVFSGHLHTMEKNLLRCDWAPDASKVRGLNGNL